MKRSVDIRKCLGVNVELSSGANVVPEFLSAWRRN